MHQNSTEKKITRRTPAKKPPARRPRGRPSQLNEAKVDEICKRIAAGESLVGICRSANMPDASTIRRWLAKGDVFDAEPHYADFRTRYARAREDQADSLADEILDEARAVTEKNANAKRVLIDALKWRAGKLKPKVYGNKLDHEVTGTNGGPIPLASLDLSEVSPEEAARFYMERMRDS